MNVSDLSALARNLRQAAEPHMTQTAAARRAQLGQERIGKWEAGRCLNSAAQFLTYVESFGYRIVLKRDPVIEAASEPEDRER